MSAVIEAVKPGGWTGQAQSKDRVRRYSLVYTIRTTDPGDGPMTVGNSPSLPGYGAYYAYGNEMDMGALLKSRVVRQANNQKCWWEVVDSYDSQHDDENPDSPIENPLDRPPKRRFSYERQIWHPHKDKDDLPFVNSAKERYGAEVSETEKGLLVLTITRNESSFPTAITKDYQNKVNENEFYGFARDQALMADVSAQDAWENEVYYWACSYKIVFDPDGWIPLSVLDEGSYYWDGGGANVGKPDKHRNFVDGTGAITTGSRPLSGSGDKLSEANIQAGNFEYNEFRKYDRADFNALDLEW